MHIYNNISRNDLVIVIARYNEDITNFIPFNNNSIIYNKGVNDINELINKDNIINCENVGREGGTYIKHIIDNYDNLSNYIIFTQGNPIDHVHADEEVKTFNKFHEIFNEIKDYKFKFISTRMMHISKNTLVEYGSGIPLIPIELGNPKNIEDLIKEIREWVDINCPNEICINPAFVPMNNPGNGIIRDLNNMIQTGKKDIFPFEFTEICIKDFWYLTSGNGNKLREELSLNFDYNKILPLIENGYAFGYGAIFIVHKSHILKHSKAFWIKIYSAFQTQLPGAGWGLEKLWRFLLE